MAADALERSVLESKDKEQLLAIAKALGVSASSRSRKSDIIGLILDTTNPPGNTSTATGASAPSAQTAIADRLAEVETARPPTASDGSSEGNGDTRGDIKSEPAAPGAGEPLAAWERDLAGEDDDAGSPATASSQSGQGQSTHQGGSGAPSETTDGESRSRRRRRRRKGRGGQDGLQGEDQPEDAVESEQGGNEPASNEPVPVSGYLDMRDEGYGFLRINGYLASREDSYVPVRLARQFGLRRGDHVTGVSRPAQRNEKNPALLEIHSVNGDDPQLARSRPRFEDLTALFPDEKLRMESDDPSNMMVRIIDLVSPIGKGQRGIIVSPPKAGKTTVMKAIAKSIEANHPEVTLMVLLIDERPEEVTDMRRMVTNGEVISSTFDRPSEEHTHVAELAIEKAKRLVEQGKDVVVILDGITRLSRAYNLAAPASGRILSGGIDAGALYPPKRFFGAARNVEEGGSLTILATALVETNSRMDEAIFEEFKGTGNMELRLDRKLAERRIYPAIDVDASSTRHEELLFDRMQLQQVWKLRRVLSGLAADGNAAPGLELLMDRLKTFRSNDEFLAEIAKQPTM
ncbi:hypothetical protein BH20ACT4_BH20ACT4_06480 [soil metagenome]